MDEEPKIEADIPWPIEEITDNCEVFRQTIPNQRTGTKPRRFPNEANFGLREDEDYLSFNWNKYISVDRNYKIIGITKNRKGNFNDVDGFRVFRYPVIFLRNLDQVKSVEHVPVFHGMPSDEGSPNNKSHAGVYLVENDEAFRTIMADYCKENLDLIETQCDFQHTNEEIKQLRERGNQTPYHKDWNFEDFDL